MSEIPVLRTEEDVDAVFAREDERSYFLFKHSLTCPISMRAHHRFVQFIEQGPDADCGLIEIQNSRALSTGVATRTQVRHESPQALLIRDGKVVWHASHGAIREEALQEALDQACKSV